MNSNDKLTKIKKIIYEESFFTNIGFNTNSSNISLEPEENLYKTGFNDGVREVKGRIKEIFEEEGYNVIREITTENGAKITEYDKDHIFYNGRQFISLERYQEAISETKKECNEDMDDKLEIIELYVRDYYDTICENIHELKDKILDVIDNDIPVVADLRKD